MRPGATTWVGTAAFNIEQLEIAPISIAPAETPWECVFEGAQRSVARFFGNSDREKGSMHGRARLCAR
jgi:hypothetical protein